MSDPNAPQADQPTQEELNAYIEQLREADATEVVAQAYTILGTGAEVKLGRPDARMLIDALAAMTDAVGGAVESDLAQRMRNGVAQLQTAQVQAERDAAAPGPPSADAAAPAAGAEQPPPPTAGEPQQGSPSDRLWIPGREPR